MSFRFRLTLLVTILTGVALILLSAASYFAVSGYALDWVDTHLADVADAFLKDLRVSGAGQFNVLAFRQFRPGDSYIIQVWSIDRRLLFATSNAPLGALDELGWRIWQPVYTTTQGEYGQLRVLSVPLVTRRGPMGMLMVGYSLQWVEKVQQALRVILIGGTIGLTLIVLGLAWVLTGHAVAPLRRMAEEVPTIVQAEDLSRRIPLSIAPDDEVGRLAREFNSILERLEQLFTAQRRFLADVSHELRTPLTVIKGEVGLMRRMGEMDQESLSAIDSEVDRLTRMVGDLLLLAQAESGKMPLAVAAVDLDDVLMEVFQHVQVLAGDKLRIVLGEVQPVQVQGDRDRLKQVLLNLVSNAVMYTPAGGEVSITLRQVGEQAQVIVRDTGPGIAPADLPHIFERFYRGERSRTRRKGSGFGLGLSISYWIVRNHGGTIEVTSQEGEGSTFCVWLPLRGPTG
ncbi:MAG: HAMP domain-containing protein [Anaerolinea sp.]|nr:HAMP domain-containing protein [Anaerolinea sp.]